ncbi:MULTISPECIES: hypothetical protein [unclassified Streptomyces]|uniref:hypothetical protein n=1 Tax=unclassified Streptomyces TaxID=2593676 RepID=UPI002E328C7D|nr:hypothetical protein [Streptomyces sp. NBC_01268]
MLAAGALTGGLLHARAGVEGVLLTVLVLLLGLVVAAHSWSACQPADRAVGGPG